MCLSATRMRCWGKGLSRWSKEKVKRVAPVGEPAGVFCAEKREAFWCARRRIPVAPAGPDAPTTARTMGLPPRRGSVLSFGAKESTKESKRHGATEKRLLLPILTAGLAMSRAMELDSYHLRLERARARLFPPSKWAGLFPSAAYRRSAPPQLALSRLKRRCLG